MLVLPGWQALFAQTSPVVQVSPSSHATVLALNVQPKSGLHVSSVQTFLSSHGTGAPPWHLPVLQVSPDVHALLSSHTLPSVTGANPHLPVLPSQLLLVHTSALGSHVTTVLGSTTHLDAAQINVPLHRSPSS